MDLYSYCSRDASKHKYMCAMLIRAMRHCSSASDDLLLNVVVNSEEFDEVRLMAAESLLAKRIDSLSDQVWARINNSLSNESLKPRLRKNIILLLRQVRDRDPQTFKPQLGDDQILFDAFEIEEGTNIFDQSEPQELMDYFDSDYRDDAFEYGELMTTVSY